jgi:hypothetical protein
MDLEGSGAEALDGGQGVAGGFGPAERLGVGVVSVDVGVDGRLELGGRAVSAAAQRTLGEAAEEALDLVEPGRAGGREVHVPAWALGEPVADRLGIVAAGVVEHEVDLEVGRDAGVDGVEEAPLSVQPVRTESSAASAAQTEMSPERWRHRCLQRSRATRRSITCPLYPG